MTKTIKMTECPECGGTKFKSVRMTEEFEIGRTMFCVTVPAEQCLGCEEDYVSGPDMVRAELLVVGEVARAGLFSADAFSFMRGALGIKGAELAELLQVTPESVSRWENEKREVNRSAALKAKRLPRTVAVGDVR